jgi:hypothetical protein
VSWDTAAELLPADDSGRQLTPRDCEFLGIEPRQVQWWSERSAPLGMTPEVFAEFRSSLFDALRADGFEPSQVDMRVQGSSARFFSGEHKSLPTRDELLGNPDAVSRMDEWLGGAEPPLRRPFDSMNHLGLEMEPSDYDIQISSDAMADRARSVAAEQFPGRPVFHEKYHFITKLIARKAFPNLVAWRKRWTQSPLGRDVAPAVFGGDGPPDTSDSGPSSHFRDDDWVIKQGEERVAE